MLVHMIGQASLFLRLLMSGFPKVTAVRGIPNLSRRTFDMQQK